MKCPYCQKEMIKGYLQSRDRLGWNENERLIIDYADDQTEA